MRKNLRCKTHRDTLCALRKQKRELDWEFHRLLVTTVVRSHPVCSLRIEYNLFRKFAQTGLDITGSRIRVSCEDVTPVTLAVNQIVLLTELYQCTEN